MLYRRHTQARQVEASKRGPEVDDGNVGYAETTQGLTPQGAEREQGPGSEAPAEDPRSKAELQEALKALGKAVSGNKDELVERLAEAEQERAELQAQARELELDDSGTADELRARIDAKLAE
ncbi:SAP domain-containing protein [Amycolatopsis thermoflava]|uniref:SAP domain-containing protein n=1 Tax=Amycolatopsis thermoflava TaxID=84480 RepID=UPI003808E17E